MTDTSNSMTKVRNLIIAGVAIVLLSNKSQIVIDKTIRNFWRCPRKWGNSFLETILMTNLI